MAFSQEDIKKGECVERGVMIPLINCDGNENPHFFTWSDDRKTWAMGSGYLLFITIQICLIFKKSEILKIILEVIALKDIVKGEELRGTYAAKNGENVFKIFNY